MYKYKDLFVDDKVTIVKNTHTSELFTDRLIDKIVATAGTILTIKHDPKQRVPSVYSVYIDCLEVPVVLSRKDLLYYGHTKLTPLQRVLSDGSIIKAAIKGLHTESNKSIIHVNQEYSAYPICGSRANFYTALLQLAPAITCQKCLSIMYHRRRALIESLKYS